jgi:hypothetical protein
MILSVTQHTTRSEALFDPGHGIQFPQACVISSKLFPFVSGSIASVTTSPSTLMIAAADSAANKPCQCIKNGNKNTPTKAAQLSCRRRQPFS